MDFYKIPIGFGMALAQNTAAINHYAHMTESQKQDILNKAHNVRSERKCMTWWHLWLIRQFNKERANLQHRQICSFIILLDKLACLY